MPMNLKELLQFLPECRVKGNADISISSLQIDSRADQAGACYVAIPGTKVDGNQFIADVVTRGALAIVSQKPCPSGMESIVWVQVADAHRAIGLLASAWYNFPSNALKVVGVTGTNGKTTTAFLVHSLFKRAWHRAGLLGTIITDDGKVKAEASQTTPGALALQGLLGRMVDNRCVGVAMEVSSHAISQQRIAGVDFDVAIFTNLTQDHLDFHGNMENYFMAKAALFEEMALNKTKKKKVALINIDDSYGKRLVEILQGRMPIKTYGATLGADFRMQTMQTSSQGCTYELTYKGKSYLIKSPLIGRFNMYNSLAALAGAVCAGLPIREAIAGIADSPQVPGRLEFAANKESIIAFVDYAHTPDAIENVCSTVKEICPRRLIVVFGCGGDRDKSKRALMGKAAAKHADICIVTSDNPRNEDPDEIIRQICEGMPKGGVAAITDRAEAIHAAVREARKGDIILIAGKGHERYQEFADGKRMNFNDVSRVRIELGELEEMLNLQRLENLKNKPER